VCVSFHIYFVGRYVSYYVVEWRDRVDVFVFSYVLCIVGILFCVFVSLTWVTWRNVILWHDCDMNEWVSEVYPVVCSSSSSTVHSFVRLDQECGRNHRHQHTTHHHNRRNSSGSVPSCHLCHHGSIIHLRDTDNGFNGCRGLDITRL